MNVEAFLCHFERNRRPDAQVDPGIHSELSGSLRKHVIHSLQSFQLGEASGGRIHSEVSTSRDPALTPRTRRAIKLYVEEEWRHARELGALLQALGAPLLKAHWSNAAFTSCRRLIGLRMKLLTMAVAEVVGIVYYRALARGAGSPALARVLEGIARDEERHLDFQAAWFGRALSLKSPWRLLRSIAFGACFCAVIGAALGCVWLEHRHVLRAVGMNLHCFARGCMHEIESRRALFRVALGPARLSPSRHVL